MSKEDVIDYVMTTPGNSNRAVLNGMLDDMIKQGSVSLVTKTYAMDGTFMSDDNFGVATVILDEPIDKSKIRAMWAQQSNFLVGSLRTLESGEDANQIERITYGFMRPNSLTGTTEFGATLYITIEQ